MKLGHGGTLDPLATGVLIVGVGSGTKALPSFLSCTKTYETVVLFGASSDTYDTEGRVVARAQYDHLTQEGVESALERFRGKIMQIPPLWSAIRVEGKHMYEYAREGKEPPKKLVERPMETTEVTLLEWLPGRSHRWSWPEEAPEEEKAAAAKLLHAERVTENDSRSDVVRQKRKVGDEDGGEDKGSLVAKKLKVESEKPTSEHQSTTPEATARKPSESSTQETPCQAPAARIRLTVSSGFYVRSFAHDLGQAVSSLALMANLVRSRQGDFELSSENSSSRIEKDQAKEEDKKPTREDGPIMDLSGETRMKALEYGDLDKGEDSWGPKVEGMLKAWNERQSLVSSPGHAQHKRNTSSPESE